MQMKEEAMKLLDRARHEACEGYTEVALDIIKNVRCMNPDAESERKISSIESKAYIWGAQHQLANAKAAAEKGNLGEMKYSLRLAEEYRSKGGSVVSQHINKMQIEFQEKIERIAHERIVENMLYYAKIDAHDLMLGRARKRTMEAINYAAKFGIAIPIYYEASKESGYYNLLHIQ